MLGNRHRRRAGHHQLHRPSRAPRSGGNAEPAPGTPCSDRCARDRARTDRRARARRAATRSGARRPPDRARSRSPPTACPPARASPTSASSSGVRNRKPFGSAKNAPQHVDVNQRILFGGRHEHRAIGDQRQAEVGVGSSGTTRTARGRTRRRGAAGGRAAPARPGRSPGTTAPAPPAIARSAKTRSLRSMKRCMCRSRATGKRSTRSPPSPTRRDSPGG